MKLEKGIEIIEQRIASPHLPWNAEDFRALRLSIEALKRIREGRSPDRRYVCYLLPGETDKI